METDFDLTTCARTPRANDRLVAQFLAVVFLFVSLSQSGCAIVGTRNEWQAPRPYTSPMLFGATDACFAGAEAQYFAGQQAEANCDAICIERYFAAATQSWSLQTAGAAAGENRATDLYRAAVRSFVESAARFDRFDRYRGIQLANGALVPVTYQGFVWQPADFCTFVPVGYYDSQRLTMRFVAEGAGVPYVVLTPCSPRLPFTRSAQPFAATAVVAPSRGAGGCFTLQFYDPLRAEVTDLGLPIARDITAPIAYAAANDTDGWIADFLEADSDDPMLGLHMREPFQPGKIPVVFVHGLASDPLTWAELENELRNQPTIFSRYQFWFFRYDTGDPFLASAARLRRELAALRHTYDPTRGNPNLSRMVMVGHSMGGLLTKMQVTYSGDAVWSAAATQPFGTIVTDAETRTRLADSFFFAPSPDIRRVVYIATPHRGSNTATRCVGRLSSALVEERPDWVARHQQLVRDNPCAFRDELRRGIPTSVDLLEPESCILRATETLPYGQGVALHSIIGDDRLSLTQGPTDGVVAVSSARIGCVQSELFVDAKHTEVQRNSRTVREMICILQQHAMYMQ